MYPTRQLRSALLQTTGQAVEGEALATAGAMSSLEAQRGGEIQMAPGAMQSVPYQPVTVVDAMQTVRPGSSAECPPCPPPSVIYRDRIVYRDKIVYRDRNVPGPPGPTIYRDRVIEKVLPGTNTVVYIDRVTGQQLPGPNSAGSYGSSGGTYFAVPPGAGQESPEPAGAGAGAYSGGGSGMATREAGAEQAGKGILWLLIAAAVGTVWYLDKKKKT